MPASDKDSSTTVHRVDGKLHAVHELRDEAGKRVGTVAERLKVEFHLEDVGQLVAGAFVMALPVALTGEVWDLGGDLSLSRALIILAVSLVTLSAFIWSLFYGKRVGEYKGHFAQRVAAAYLVAFSVSLLLLILFEKAPLDNLQLALTRTIIVTFPACFAATAVDFIK